MKSFLLTANSTDTTVAAGGVVPLGSAVHGYGSDIKLNGNAIQLKTPGYYNVDVAVTAAVTGTDSITVTMYLDGVAVSGAEAAATPAAAGEVVAIAFPWTIRKACCCDVSTVSFVCSGAASVQDTIVRVEKV